MTNVWVGVIDHRQGTDLYASATEAGIWAQLAAWVREQWPDCGPDETMPEDNFELVDAYFEFQSERGDEWRRVEEIPLEGSP